MNGGVAPNKNKLEVVRRGGPPADTTKRATTTVGRSMTAVTMVVLGLLLCSTSRAVTAFQRSTSRMRQPLSTIGSGGVKSSPPRQHNYSNRQWALFSAVAPNPNEPAATQRRHNSGDNGGGSTSMPSVILKRTHQSKSFRNGNQLVFSKAIQRTTGGELAVGQLVQVQVEGEKDQNPIMLGWGVYNPNSLYRVRMLCHRFLLPPPQYKQMAATIADKAQDEAACLELILQQQFVKAWKTRQAMQLAPATTSDNNEAPLSSTTTTSTTTDTFRLLNGEGDQVSGLAMDVIGGDTVVVMSSAAWCEIHKTTILSSLQSVLPSAMKVVWKTTPSRLVQDGYESQSSVEKEVTENVNEMVLSMENGIKYATFPFRDGQKTGVYCDQRENRFSLAPYCRDKKVLDLCCYHGGFSLNAVLHGNAQHTTGVDSSQEAIDVCWENAQLNQIPKDKVDFVKSEIASFLQQKERDGQDQYDVIVLDPPKLAPSASGLDKARRKYHSFNRDALKLINTTEGGLLLTCTCSAAMTQKDGGQYFLSMVQGAALAAGRDVTLLRVSGAAPCHTQSPISWPAGAYLTAALFRVHPVTTVN